VSPPVIRVGLISDTHSLLRPQALAALAGSDFLIHAGDVGDPSILRELAHIAPLTAVCGNNDRAPWAAALREREFLRVGEVSIEVLHDLAQRRDEPAQASVDVVVSGHSHRPTVKREKGVLFVNPGSAGPRRFRLPVSVALLLVSGRDVTPRLIELDV